MGNITRDPQTKHLPSNTVVVEFGLAVNRKWRSANGEDREDVLFVDCTCFGKPGEVIAQYCQKGKPLFVEGHLKLDQWEDKQGGKRSKITVVVDNFQLMGGKPGDREGDGDRDEPRQERQERSPATTGARTRQQSRGAERGGERQQEGRGSGFGEEQTIRNQQDAGFGESDIPF